MIFNIPAFDSPASDVDQLAFDFYRSFKQKDLEILAEMNLLHLANKLQLSELFLQKTFFERIFREKSTQLEKIYFGPT